MGTLVRRFRRCLFSCEKEFFLDSNEHTYRRKSMADNTVQQLAGAVLPTALRELLGAQGQIEEIARYFEQAFGADPDKNKVFRETQVYTKNALGNVAFHVNVVGSHMVSFLNKQFDELDTMQLQF